MSRISKIQLNEILDNQGFRDGRRSPAFPIDFDDITGLDRPEQEADVTRNKQAVRCVCDIAGTGDFTDLELAVDYANSFESGGTVYIKEGIYTVNTDLELNSNICLEGVSPQTTIINFATAANQVKVHGTNLYSTGTISVTNGAMTVTGSGTSWLTEATVGQAILLGDSNWYKITAIASDTSLTIDNVFFGDTQTDATYKIATIKENISLNHLAVILSGTDGMSFYLTNNVKMYNVFSLYHGGKGIKMEDANWNILDYVIGAYNTSDGFYATSMYNSVMSRFFCIQNAGNGMNLDDDIRGCSLDYLKAENNVKGLVLNGCVSNFFSKIDARTNSDTGIYVTGSSNCSMDVSSKSNTEEGMLIETDNTAIIVTSSYFESNGADGVKIDDNSDETIVTASFLKDNGAYGINVASADCNDTFIRNNQYDSNTSGEWSDSGTDTKTDMSPIPVTTKGDLYGYSTDVARIPVGTNDQVLTADSNETLGVKWADAIVTTINYFSDASDGDHTTTGNETLSADKDYDNLVVDTGHTLNPDGYIIRAKTKITIKGSIARIGNDGDTASSTEGSSDGDGGAALNTNTIFGSVAGADGGRGAARSLWGGDPGDAGADAANSIAEVDGAAGGAGQDGGAGGAGGTATKEDLEITLGAVNTETITSVDTEEAITLVRKLTASGENSGATLSGNAGAGGGGGGDTAITSGGSGGGGGGGGGGTILIIADEVEISATGSINVTGGNGGDGGTWGDDGGGGGGGAGGLIVIICRTYTNNGSLILSGGLGGDGHNGVDGTAGNAGKYIICKIE